jgi:signal transduction histidine kinase
MSQTMNFRASTNVKSLFGKDLVTDEITAVFELVKNSYDADAIEVLIEFSNLKSGTGSLIIKDNGTGMDLYDLENKWMVIGTESKKGKEFSDVFGRPLNGDKGIGRFSVDRLGEELKLTAVKSESHQRIKMEFDWSIFEDEYNNLESINVPYEIEMEEREGIQGVVLEIEKLRDSWDEKSIAKLIKSLRHFKSPFSSVEDNFSIIVYAPDFFEEPIEIMPYRLEDMSNLWVRTTIPVDNQSKIEISIYRDGIEYKEEYQNIYEFGPIYQEVYFFDTPGKIRFNNRMGMRVKDFGNVRLYRDDFRIHPYGEEWNDWLDLDRRKTQGTSRFFGTRDLIGFVQIRKQYNKEIEVLTNRQGLKENEYYTQLKEFILDYSIKTLEKYFFKKAKNESFQEAKKNIVEAVKDLSKVSKELQKTSPAAAKIIRQAMSVVQKSQSEQTQFVKNQEEVLNVYKRVANKEILLHKIIHEALIRIKNVKTVSSSGKRQIRYYKTNEKKADAEFVDLLEKRFIKIDKLTDDARDYLMGARDHLIRERTKESIDLIDFAKQFINVFQEEFRRENISLTFTSSDSLHYKMDVDDYKTMFNNFLSNSIKSLMKSNKTNKEVIIQISENQRNIIIIFKDNGVGVPEHIRDRIFDPFFSTTEGFGMGLSIVDEIIKEYNGELNLARNYSSGAEFQIKLRK